MADRWAILGLLIATALTGLPLILRPNGIAPMHDWDSGLRSPPAWTDEFYFFGALDFVSLAKHHQFPLWSPHMAGGFPIMGLPDTNGLSLRVVLIWIFGVVPAFKVDFLLCQAIGAIGAYLLMRRVAGLGVAAPLVTATCYAFGGLGALWIRHEMHAIRGAATPLLLFLLYTARGRPWRLLGATLVLVWMLGEQTHPFFFALWFMVVAILLRVFETAPERRGPNWGLLGRLAVAVAWAALTLSAKWVALLPVIAQSGRSVIGQEEGFNPPKSAAVWVAVLAVLALLTHLSARGLVSGRRDIALRLAVLGLAAFIVVAAPPWEQAATWADRVAALTPRVHGLVSYGTLADPMAGFFGWETWNIHWGVPVGHVGFALALLALLTAPRRLWRWLVLGVVWALITLGPVLPFDLARVIQEQPFPTATDKQLKNLGAYRCLYLACLAGWGLHLVLERVRRRRPAAVAPVAVAVVGLNVLLLAHMAAPRTYYSVSATPGPGPEPGRFHSVEYTGGRPYQWPLANVGLRHFDAYLPNPDDQAVLPKLLFDDRSGRSDTNPAYRGEVYFRWNNKDNRVEWPETGFSPNHWRFDVTVVEPNDVLIINQVYDRYWRSNMGPVMYRSGLMTVALPKPGTFQVQMWYQPTPFFWGLGVGGAALLGGIGIVWWMSRRGRRPRRG